MRKIILLLIISTLLSTGCQILIEEGIRPVDETVVTIKTLDEGLSITTHTINSGVGHKGHETVLDGNRLIIRVLETALVTEDTKDNPPLIVEKEILDQIDAIYLEDDTGAQKEIWTKVQENDIHVILRNLIDQDAAPIDKAIDILKNDTKAFVEAYKTLEPFSRDLVKKSIKSALSIQDEEVLATDFKDAVNIDLLSEEEQDLLLNILGPSLYSKAFRTKEEKNEETNMVLSIDVLKEKEWHLEEVVESVKSVEVMEEVVALLDIDKTYDLESLKGFMTLLDYLEGSYQVDYSNKLMHLFLWDTEDFLSAYLSQGKSVKDQVRENLSLSLDGMSDTEIVSRITENLKKDNLDPLEQDALSRLLGEGLYEKLWQSDSSDSPEGQMIWTPIFISYPGDNPYIYSEATLIGGYYGNQWVTSDDMLNKYSLEELVNSDDPVHFYSSDAYKGSREVEVDGTSINFQSLSSEGEVLLGYKGEWDGLAREKILSDSGYSSEIDLDGDGQRETIVLELSKIVFDEKMIDGVTLTLIKNNQVLLIDEIEAVSTIVKAFTMDLNGDGTLEITLVNGRHVCVYTVENQKVVKRIDY